MDGLDLATEVAKYDPDPEVKAAVIGTLEFRYANRHIADVLHCADERTFDLVVRRGIVDNATDEDVKKGIEAARERQLKEGVSAQDRLRTIMYAQDGEDLSGKIACIIGEVEIKDSRDVAVDFIYRMRDRYPLAIGEGLLHRVRAGHKLFYGAENLLASAGFRLEDEALVNIALSETARHDDRAEAAASVLGPQAVGRMIGTAFEVKRQIRAASGSYNQAAGDRYHDLLVRIRHTPGSSLIAAVRARSAQAGNEELSDLAELISRHRYGEDDHCRSFDAGAITTIHALAEDWGNRMLASGDATRSQLASVASLATQAPSVALLPLLKRLLDQDLHRWRAFKEQARIDHYRGGVATNEARTSWTLQYQRAFQAISGTETTALMCEYLSDLDFGPSAAIVLANQWTTTNEPRDIGHSWGRVDFSRVEEKRDARAKHPAETSAEADAIFNAIDLLITDGATEEQKKHAVALGIIAARLPHGQRDATIQKLISLASRQQRAALLQNLILSGENVKIELVKNGLSEMFEAAQKDHWILSDGYELREWLRLLPFSNPSSEVSAVVRGLPDEQRRVDWLEDMIAGFRTAPGDDAERNLYQLAEDNPKLYRNYTWCDVAIRRGSLSSSQRFVDLAANGAFSGKGFEDWHTARQIGNLMSEYAELRERVYQLLENGATTSGRALLAQAVAESPDAVGLLLLMKIGPQFVSRFTIEKVVTEHVPSEDLKGAYSIVPVPSVELRQKLLAMTVTGSHTAVATHCLHLIDEIRDEYGVPDSEPRHPDLASGKQWPIMNGPEYTA